MARFYKTYLLKDMSSNQYIRYIDCYAERSNETIVTTDILGNAMMFDSVFEAEQYIRAKAVQYSNDVHLSFTIIETFNIQPE